MKTRIRWTGEERELVTERMAEILRHEPRISKQELWVKSQDILEKHRQRLNEKLVAGERLMFERALKLATVQAPPAPQTAPPAVDIVFCPVPTPEPLEGIPLKVLLAEVFGRVFGEGLLVGSAPTHGLPPGAPTATRPLTIHHPEARTRAPKVGVIGLLPDQFRHVKERVNNKKVELVFIDKDQERKGWAETLDYAVVTRHSSHAIWEQVQAGVPRGRYVFVNTGIESVVGAVETFVPGARN